ncbi:hypothetical protein F4561_005608 [Lipingzhangella halophila]|uniref:Uncharacterized protein n=1 Tax=Lipingzhangella halophila TaxID=1783352 RepID=A0A7W7RMI5_9ACTN|nr:hypothetical protein [Lipingzhangella halophila]MBB4929190.1 hypothetical protein [Lipingzhangella halophila]MBB4934714.1 hypothetical protein [Lipingzhangella halophila]
MHPMPEITAIHILAALSETAPPDVVIALSDDERVLVGSAADMRHPWRGHWQATLVATRTEIAAALSPQQRRDLDAIDALADTLTTHAATLLSAPAAAAA